jgi:hypothetical protein
VGTDEYGSSGLNILAGLLGGSAEKFARVWHFQGSGNDWSVMFLSNVASPDADQNARAFFKAILGSTRDGEPPIPQDSGGVANPIRWLNPITGRSVQLDAIWRINPFVPDKTNPWAFNSLCLLKGNQCEGSHEAVAARFFPDASPTVRASYTDALRSANDPTYRMLDSVKHIDKGGRRVWTGQGRGDVEPYGEHNGYIRFWLFRGNGGVWRVSYVADPGFVNENSAYQFFESVLATTDAEIAS